jgi:hypothetical protein
MRWFIFLVVLAGCKAADDSEVTVQSPLETRVVQLEKRVKTLEKRLTELKQTAAKKKPDHEKEKEKDREKRKKDEVTGPAGTVNVEGDAKRVLLTADKKRVSLPGAVGEGEYTIMAAFGEEKPIEVGALTVVADKIFTVTCDAKLKTCTVGS